ncbi:MAG: hypothetical protein KAS32_27065 [Candidatus Peribacteraceae bacterium]|nr:hypothetical protein [Candidatus Peribacteraceae bacterium]
MNNPKWKWLDKLGDIFCSVVLLAAIALCAIFMMLTTGCSTCPPCQPTLETVEVQVPVYSCPEPPQMSLPDVPALPDPPIPSADEEELKSWYAQMASLVKARERILLEYVKALQSVIEEYRTP